MSKYTIAIIAVLIIATGWFLYIQNTSPADTGAPLACNYNDPDRMYVFKSSEMCMQPDCEWAPDLVFFQDECGCGCQRVAQKTESNTDGSQAQTEAQLTAVPYELLQADQDNDGLSDFEELYSWSTDPENADSDGDGFADGYEIINFYNPAGSGDLTGFAFDAVAYPYYPISYDARVALAVPGMLKDISDPALQKVVEAAVAYNTRTSTSNGQKVLGIWQLFNQPGRYKVALQNKYNYPKVAFTTYFYDVEDLVIRGSASLYPDGRSSGVGHYRDYRWPFLSAEDEALLNNCDELVQREYTFFNDFRFSKDRAQITQDGIVRYFWEDDIKNFMAEFSNGGSAQRENEVARVECFFEDGILTTRGTVSRVAAE